MDLVVAVAGTIQLLAYSHSASKVLLQLIIAIKQGPAAYRDYGINLRLLLDVISQIVEPNSRLQSNSLTISIILEITDLAQRALNLLPQTTSLFAIIRHTATHQRSALDESFDALSRKREILHLHISQTHLLALSELRTHLKSQSSILMSEKEAQETMGSNNSRTASVSCGHYHTYSNES